MENSNIEAMARESERYHEQVSAETGSKGKKKAVSTPSREGSF